MIGAIMLISVAAAQPKVAVPRLVAPYMKRNGTYVMPSMRTPPNRSRLDNWSTKGNTNPFSGKAGTKPSYPLP